VPAFCDYILYWTYCGGGDWPSFNGANNNWYAGNRMLPAPGRVRFFVWDCEDSWINLPNRPGPPHDGARIVNELLTGPLDISILWRGVQAVPDFRLQWADRVHAQCYNDGPLSEANVLARWNTITAVVDRLTVGESARWGRFDPRGITWTRNADWVPYTNAVRQMFAGNTPQLVAALRNTAVPSLHPSLYPSIEPPLFQVGALATTIAVTRATVQPGTTIALVRHTPAGTIWFTTDGSDPRDALGQPIGQNGGTGITVPVAAALRLRARTLVGTEWSALHRLDLDVVPGITPVQIHEALAENVDGIVDEWGDHDDWVELHNRGLVDFDLSGHHLTDNLSQPTKWTFPAGTTIRAGGTLLVWTDDEAGEGLLHTTFRLSGNGESIGLFAPGGAQALDQFSFGPQSDDESIGRLFGEPASLVIFPQPSPHRPNTPAPCGHLAFQARDQATNPRSLRGLGVPSAGDALRYEMEDLTPGSVAVLALAERPQYVAIPGLGTLLIDPILLLPAVAAPDGEAKFSFGLPDQTNVRGVVLYAQGAADVTGAIQLTNGVVSRVCP
jgi:hypothetical protein